MRFFIRMIPPTATGQMRAVTVRNGKPYFYDPPEVAAARSRLAAYLAPHKPPEPMKGPVGLSVTWHFPRGSHKAGYKPTRPDTDNLQKLLKDEMSRVGFWRDDAQVCIECVEKLWSDTPGLEIVVKELEE